MEVHRDPSLASELCSRPVLVSDASLDHSAGPFPHGSASGPTTPFATTRSAGTGAGLSWAFEAAPFGAL